MRIQLDGKVGIGTTSPMRKLDIRGSGSNSMILSAPNNTDYIDFRLGAGSSIGRIGLSGPSFGDSNYGTDDLFIQTETEGGNIRFMDNGAATRMIIQDNGNVGIGTTSPGAKLDVEGKVEIGSGGMTINSSHQNNFQISTISDVINPNFYFAIGNGSGGSTHQPIFWNNMLIFNGSGNSWCPTCGTSPQAAPSTVDRADMVVTPAGRVGIGTTTPSNILTVVQGSTTDPIADAWTQYSSRRWKTNIQTIESALDKVQQLRGVTYEWKANGKHDIGLIAEEVGEIIPEVVEYEENGVDAKSVDYARLVAVLIEAVKEQQKMIEKLQDEKTSTTAELKQTKQSLQNVEARLAEVDNLKMKMAQLEAYLQKLLVTTENQTELKKTNSVQSEISQNN